MWLPPYLGDSNSLLKALLHNPFLGSGHDGPHHHMSRSASDPQPMPWRSEFVAAATSFLVSAVGAKVTGENMRNQKVGHELAAAANASIVEFVDEYCGTPYPGWHFPGPPPWIFGIMTELTVAAATMTEDMRAGLTKVSGDIETKAFGQQASGA